MKVEAESSIMLPYGLSRARQKHNNTGHNHNQSLPDEAQRWWVPSLQQLSKSSEGLSGKNLAGSLSKLAVVEVSNQHYRSSTRQTGCPTGTLANDRPNSTTNKPGSLNRKHDSIQLTLHDNVEVVDLVSETESEENDQEMGDGVPHRTNIHHAMVVTPPTSLKRKRLEIKDPTRHSIESTRRSTDLGATQLNSPAVQHGPSSFIDNRFETDLPRTHPGFRLNLGRSPAISEAFRTVSPASATQLPTGLSHNNKRPGSVEVPRTKRPKVGDKNWSNQEVEYSRNLISAQQRPHPVVRDEVSHQAVHIESVETPHMSASNYATVRTSGKTVGLRHNSDHRVTESLTRSVFPIKTEDPEVIESVHLIDPGILGNKTSTAFLPVRARQFGWATPNLKMDLSDIHDPELQRQVARLMAVYPYTARYLFDLLIEHEGNYETALRTLQSSNKKNIPRREMPSLISDISNKRIIYSPCPSRLSPLEAPAEHVEQEISHRSLASVVKKEEEEETKYNIMELIGEAGFDMDNDSLEADPNLRTARHRYVSPVKPNQCGKEKSQNNRGVSGNRKPTTPRTNLTPVANMGSKRAQKPRKAKAKAVPKPHPPFSPACVLPRPSRDWSEAYSDVSMASRR